MRQRGSRRVRPRPNSRENLTSPVSCTAPSSSFDQSNDISSGSSNVEERLPEVPGDVQDRENLGVNDRRTRSVRYKFNLPIFGGPFGRGHLFEQTVDRVVDYYARDLDFSRSRGFQATCVGSNDAFIVIATLHRYRSVRKKLQIKLIKDP